MKFIWEERAKALITYPNFWKQFYRKFPRVPARATITAREFDFPANGLKSITPAIRSSGTRSSTGDDPQSLRIRVRARLRPTTSLPGRRRI